jgi:hypothetical protein
MLGFTFSSGTYQIILNGKFYTISDEHEMFLEVQQALNDELDDQEMLKLLDRATSIKKYSEGDLEITDGAVLYKGEALTGKLVSDLLRFIKEDRPWRYLRRFLEKLLQNPSYRARQEFYKFLDTIELQICQSGSFIAYKGVNDDYYSVHGGNLKLLQGHANDSGQIFNGPGEIIECERSAVNDDPSVGCAVGLHLAGKNFANSFGSKVMLLECDPRDVVSVPLDANHQKVRACKYKVLSELV